LVSGTGTYKQDADIDLLGNDSYSASGGAVTWTPLLSGGFDGTFDGDGHTIANLKVNVSTGKAGLFETNNNSGTLKNIHVTSGTVNNIDFAINSYTAGIAAINNGTISNCSNGANITTIGFYSGGIAGDSRSGNITGCYNTGALTSSAQGEAALGGIAGYGSNITGCYNTGTITGVRYAGGIVGYHTTGNIIIRCYNNGQVSGGHEVKTVGGIAGASVGKIIACYNTGAVIGSEARRIGGISGYSGLAGSAIIACYNTGALSGENVTDPNYSNGGIVAFLESGSITACYNTGTVNATGAYRGGIAGYTDGTNTITDCYWKNNTTSPPPYGIGSPANNTGAAPFSSTFIPTGSLEWGTGSGWDGTGPMPSGVWWKPGTTSGTLPRLWFE
jgi:hypothetical protein